MKHHILGGICQVLFRKKWGDFSYEQRKSLEKSRLRIPRRYGPIWGYFHADKSDESGLFTFLCKVG